MEKSTLGGGCFWCLEAVFNELRGVTNVVSGYAGGYVIDPTYEQVCAGETGHAEVVQVTFDPSLLSYEDLLRVFFAIHDPTTLNRQGADVGSQYRSVIYFHSPEQAATARRLIEALASEHLYDRAIVTEVAPLDRFYPAEAYHQRYFARHPEQGYCQAVITPKLAKFRKQFVTRLQRAQR